MNLLKALLFPLLVSSSQTCSPLGISGNCYGGPSLLNTIRSPICKDQVACFIYDNFLDPIVESANASSIQSALEYSTLNICMGDYLGTNAQTVGGLIGATCNALPLAPTTKYGFLGFTIPLPPQAQVMVGFAPPKPDTLNLLTCTAIILPTSGCPNGVTFATSWNKDAMVALVELGPKNPISLLIKEAINLGLGSFSFGVSTSGEFLFPVHLYTSAGWTEKSLKAHVYMTGVAELAIPYLPSDIIAFKGTYSEFYYISTNPVGVVNSLIGSGSTNNAAAMVGGFERGVTLTGGIVLFLSTLSSFLEDVELQLASAHFYLSASTASLVGSSAFGLPMGVYAAFHSDVLKNLAAIANDFCNQFIGVIKLVGGPSKCNLQTPQSSRLGFFFEAEGGLGFTLELPGFKLKCLVHPEKTDCGFMDQYFEIIFKAAGFVVNQVTAFGKTHGTEILKASKQTIKVAKGFSKTATVASKNAGKAAKKKVVALKRFFGGRKKSGHKEVEFGFKTKYNCKDSKETLFDTDWSDWFNEFRDDSRGECYNQCYLRAVERGDLQHSNLCCEYRKYTSSKRRCIYGWNGRESNGDNGKSVTATFVNDFLEELNAKDPGESCSSDRECESGVCHLNKCADVCDEEVKCREGQPFAYCEEDDECEGMCFKHQCYTHQFDLGHEAEHDHQCKSGFKGDGRCKVKCSSGNKCTKSTPHHYCDKDKHCSGKNAKCKGHQCNK